MGRGRLRLLRVQCEAVLQTHVPIEQLLEGRSRCNSTASHVVNGRNVCWLHAAALRNQDRVYRVLFFEELSDA